MYPFFNGGMINMFDAQDSVSEMSETEDENVYYISIASGIILAIFLSSFQALIPAHNALVEPTFW